jgi:anaerobic magnesium-protoporphyrin IX monomethyl ester cyclase
MKVLFVVNAVHRWERLGILTLSAILKQAGHEVQLFDIRGKSERKILRAVPSIGPDVLAYSTMSNEAGALLDANRLIRHHLPKAVKSVFGGPHPTFFPQMIHEDGVDAICRGEADETFPHYLEYLEGGRPPFGIPGFVIRDHGDLILNPLGKRPHNLDSIPCPDRVLWEPIDPYAAQKSFLASRGCPYRCSYCFNAKYNELYGNSEPLVRRRAVAHLIAEIQSVLKRYSEVHPFFDDDSFLLAPVEWLQEFADHYRREVARPFGCKLRADQVTEKKIQILAGAGCHYCWIGVECGDEDFAMHVLRRGLTNRQIRDAVGVLRAHHIRYATLCMNALPSDKPLETDEKTLHLNIECKPDLVVAHIFYPFPGTALAGYAQERNLFSGDYSTLTHSLCLDSPLNFDAGLKKQLERQNLLFGLAVVFPPIASWLPLARKLPLGRIYAAIHFLCLGYCTQARLLPRRRGFRHLISRIALLLRRISEAGYVARRSRRR